MRNLGKLKLGAMALFLAVMLPLVPATAQTTVTVALSGEADTFDPMVSTKDIVSKVTQHFVETLYTFDRSWNVAPLLAVDLPTISRGGTVYTIRLRRGIKFHDGSSMDSADAVASLNRWLDVAARGRGIADRVKSIRATGRYEVTITLRDPYSPLLSLLAFSNSAAAIYPEEIIADTITDVVGTGPYMIGRHVPDQYLQLVRFEDYVSRREPPNGPAGGRLQIPDEILLIPVGDESTRVEGLVSGQYDFADSLSVEAYDRIAASRNAEPILLKPFGWPIWAINHKKGLLTDRKIRQALQAALPIDDMLYAAFGDDNYFVVDASLFPDGWVWNNDAGERKYNQNNQRAARRLLRDAGYDGTPLRILTSRRFEFHFKMAEVAKVALEAAGFEVQMDVVDWATLGQRRNNPDLWDVYITHSPFLPEPALTSLWSVTARTGWPNREKEAVLKQFTAETDIEERKRLFARLQELNYEDVGFIKIGGFNALLGQRKGLTGVPANPWPFFWNARVR